MAVRFGVSSTVKNRLPRYSNFWDGTAVYNPFSPTGSYDALATYTVGAGGASSVTFSGIPQTGYSHLQLRAIITNSTGSNLKLRFNSDTNGNYNSHYLYGDGSSATAGATGTTDSNIYPMLETPNSYPAVLVLDILDYSSTVKNITTRSLAGADKNGSGIVSLASGLWRGTPKNVTEINLLCYSGSFNQYTQFALYGVR